MKPISKHAFFLATDLIQECKALSEERSLYLYRDLEKDLPHRAIYSLQCRYHSISIGIYGMWLKIQFNNRSTSEINLRWIGDRWHRRDQIMIIVPPGSRMNVLHIGDPDKIKAMGIFKVKVFE